MICKWTELFKCKTSCQRYESNLDILVTRIKFSGFLLSLNYNPASDIMVYLEVNQGQEKQTAELFVVLLLISYFPWYCGLLNLNHNFHGLPARGKGCN